MAQMSAGKSCELRMRVSWQLRVQHVHLHSERDTCREWSHRSNKVEILCLEVEQALSVHHRAVPISVLRCPLCERAGCQAQTSTWDHGCHVK
jgi:hypothetical protein